MELSIGLIRLLIWRGQGVQRPIFTKLKWIEWATKYELLLLFGVNQITHRGLTLFPQLVWLHNPDYSLLSKRFSHTQSPVTWNLSTIIYSVFGTYYTREQADTLALVGHILVGGGGDIRYSLEKCRDRKYAWIFSQL